MKRTLGTELYNLGACSEAIAFADKYTPGRKGMAKALADLRRKHKLGVTSAYTDWRNWLFKQLISWDKHNNSPWGEGCDGCALEEDFKKKRPAQAHRVLANAWARRDR